MTAKIALGLPILLLLAACQDQPAPAPLTPEALARDWRLVSLNGAAAPARATLDLREPGRAAGQAPCNRWFATRGGDGLVEALAAGATGVGAEAGIRRHVERQVVRGDLGGDLHPT